jgi:hypothetical protein
MQIQAVARYLIFLRRSRCGHARSTISSKCGSSYPIPIERTMGRIFMGRFSSSSSCGWTIESLPVYRLLFPFSNTLKGVLSPSYRIKSKFICTPKNLRRHTYIRQKLGGDVDKLWLGRIRLFCSIWSTSNSAPKFATRVDSDNVLVLDTPGGDTPNYLLSLSYG